MLSSGSDGSMRPHPHLYEINTWVWLGELSRKYGRRISLGDVPPTEWDALASRGFDGVWLMGVWQRSEAGRRIASNDSQLQREYDGALPNWQPSDVVGSPYAVRAYQPDPFIGRMNDLDRALEAIHQRGMKLILDFVPNHTAVDHEWVYSCPDYYVQGTSQDCERSPSGFFQVHSQGKTLCLAHGKDPYFPAWTDTAQLNYFNEATRWALMQELQAIAQHCDGVRCDMAMLVLNRIFARTWELCIDVTRRPETEFWIQAVTQLPGFIWMAEVYWDLEWTLQQMGFQFTYDKRLYDRLRRVSPREVGLHLSADLGYQSRSVRFLENHDEPRSAKVFTQEQLSVCATLVATLPGMRLYHHGQLEGKRIRVPVQLERQQEEPVNYEILLMYERLLSLSDEDVFHRGDWSRLVVQSIGDSTWENLLAYQWRLGRDWRMIVVNLSSLSSRGQVQIQLLSERDFSSGLEVVDQLTGQPFMFHPETLSQQCLPVHLGPYGGRVFSVKSS